MSSDPDLSRADATGEWHSEEPEQPPASAEPSSDANIASAPTQGLTGEYRAEAPGDATGEFLPERIEEAAGDATGEFRPANADSLGSALTQGTGEYRPEAPVDATGEYLPETGTRQKNKEVDQSAATGEFTSEG